MLFYIILLLFRGFIIFTIAKEILYESATSSPKIDSYISLYIAVEDLIDELQKILNIFV